MKDYNTTEAGKSFVLSISYPLAGCHLEKRRMKKKTLFGNTFFVTVRFLDSIPHRIVEVDLKLAKNSKTPHHTVNLLYLASIHLIWMMQFSQHLAFFLVIPYGYICVFAFSWCTKVASIKPSRKQVSIHNRFTVSQPEL